MSCFPLLDGKYCYGVKFIQFIKEIIHNIIFINHELKFYNADPVGEVTVKVKLKDSCGILLQICQIENELKYIGTK